MSKNKNEDTQTSERTVARIYLERNGKRESSAESVCNRLTTTNYMGELVSDSTTDVYMESSAAYQLRGADNFVYGCYYRGSLRKPKSITDDYGQKQLVGYGSTIELKIYENQEIALKRAACKPKASEKSKSSFICSSKEDGEYKVYIILDGMVAEVIAGEGPASTWLVTSYDEVTDKIAKDVLSHLVDDSIWHD